MTRLPYGSEQRTVPPSFPALEVVAASPRRGRNRAGAVEIGRALDDPVAGPALRDAVRGAASALVVVSDGTRATGAEWFLPALLDRLRGAGVREIRLAIASGLHRRPDAREIAAIVGDDLARDLPVVLHDPDDADRLVHAGATSAGTPVRVHRAALEHEAVILTGAVGFHYYAGFTGGRKAMVPGLAGRDTIARNHLRALRPDGSRHPYARAGRLSGNPVHRDMVESAALVRPAWLVNSVMAEDGGIERLFAGHWRRAHESACRYVRATRVRVLEPRAVVVASAGGHPYDVDLIQAHKAIEAAMGALAPGGTLVLMARCARGVGHDDFLRYFRYSTVDDHVAALTAEFRVYGQTALSWRRKLERCRLVLVSDLEPDLVRQLGAEPAADLEGALGVAFRGRSRNTPGWILPHGARVWIEPAAGREGAR